MTIRHLLQLALSGTLLACGYTTYQTPATSVSQEGVRVSATSGRCVVERVNDSFPPPSQPDTVKLDVKLTVQNESNNVVVLSSDRVRLAERVHGKPLETEPLESAQVSLVPGESRTVALDFQRKGPLDCRQPMDLRTEGALAVDGKPISLSPIHLVATP